MWYLLIHFSQELSHVTSEIFHSERRVNLPANSGDSGDAGLIPGSGRSLGGGNGNPLQYSCLENSMDRGSWQAVVHGVTKDQTQLEEDSVTFV